MVTVTPVSVNFPAGTLVLDQNFQVGTAVDLTLPTATGATTYRLSSHADQSLPAGLTFDGATRVLSGTPTAAQTAEGYAYSARNPDNLDNLNFDITVADTAPSSQTLTLNPTMVTESATPTDITATVTLNGGTYAVARSFSLGSSTGTATATTDFAPVQNVTLTIPANAASGTVTFPFTAVDDMETEGAETLTIRSTLLPPGGEGRDQSLAVAEATLTINDPAPMGTAPVFTNMAMFTSAISVPENTVAAGVANFFAAPGTGTTSLTLGGADMALFTLDSATGTLTFDTAPDFEMPRGMAFDASTNTNNYALTVTAMNAFGTVMSGAITVTVTDVNEAPVLPAITPTTTFVEYTAGTFDITATDVDTGQTRELHPQRPQPRRHPLIHRHLHLDAGGR